MKKLISLFLTSLILFSSCAPTIVGRAVQCNNVDCLRRSLGPPNHIIDNGNAGEIWLYSETWVKTRPGVINYNENNTTFTNPSSIEYDKTVKFWVDGDNVYRWATHGHKLKKMTPVGVVLYLAGCAGLGMLIGAATY